MKPIELARRVVEMRLMGRPKREITRMLGKQAGEVQRLLDNGLARALGKHLPPPAPPPPPKKRARRPRAPETTRAPAARAAKPCAAPPPAPSIPAPEPPPAPILPVSPPLVGVKKEEVNGRRRCRKCGNLGHIAKTCGRQPVAKEPGRHCRNCGTAGHDIRKCQEPYREPAPSQVAAEDLPVIVTPEPDQDARRAAAIAPRAETAEGGPGQGRRGVPRACARCGGIGHKKASCPERLETNPDVKLEPARAAAGERYRVIEDAEDEDTGASWRGDEVWELVERRSPPAIHPAQWLMRREDGAEEVGFPELYPFQLVPKGGSVGADIRVSFGLYERAA